MPFLCFRQSPLLPNAHANSSVQPPAHVIDRVLHACNSVVAHTTSDIDLDLFKNRPYALSASTSRVFAQLVFELLHRLWLNANIDTSAILPQRKAQKLKISDRKHAYDTAFLSVHFQFQRLFEIFRTRLQKSLCGSFASRQKNDVVRIANAWNSPFQILLIVFVEVDVRQQRRKISSLRQPFLCADDHPVFHGPASEIPLYHLGNPFVLDLPAEHVHKNGVVQRVEVFRKI